MRRTRSGARATSVASGGWPGAAAVGVEVGVDSLTMSSLPSRARPPSGGYQTAPPLPHRQQTSSRSSGYSSGVPVVRAGKKQRIWLTCVDAASRPVGVIVAATFVPVVRVWRGGVRWRLGCSPMISWRSSPRRGHFPHLDEPRRFAGLLVDFVGQTEDRLVQTAVPPLTDRRVPVQAAT